ncbi:FAD-dependent monooxygenase [Krasilnikoviella flava]|uniref:2-polyprenyl-6-methoxyphenol hydroxylase n=1 Tax=Krasilnikoviella flava TaxID=526729 RepID=A0A1T5L695_9MICO|nr:FAD-dependent monooxygenase [Krasilnikoviella flava]SKC71430.1 2-polyprenyl-6-methoxyphenol hydroxylase [Krasilnikoviella flava]
MDADVVVVGAGPTGLLLAGDLALAGARVTVVEKRPAGLSNLTRAFAVHARSLETLDARGLADELEATGRRVRRIQVFGRVDVRLDLLPGRFPFVLVTPQYEVERLLRRRAEGAGAVFRHGVRVTGLTQDDDAVTLAAVDDTIGGTGGADLRWRAPWVVGTDGVRSTVRRAAGLPFPGETVIRAMVLADVRLARPPEDALTVASSGGALGFLAPFGDDWFRFIGWDEALDPGDDGPVGLDEVRAVARATLGDDHGMQELRFATRFAADERQTTRYRSGRVLLAGDAAHVHSPAGGLGMNTGLQDAANLSWRLAAVLRGADDTVLDGYSAERHPVGAQVLRTSGTILRLATRRGPGASVLRAAGATLLARAAPARRRAAATVSALGVRYPAPPGAHPAAGRRVPDLPLVPEGAGRRLAQALRAGRFVLVAPAAGPPADIPLAGGELAAVDRVVVRRADGRDATLLVRPDGYLADARAPGAVTDGREQ